MKVHFNENREVMGCADYIANEENRTDWCIVTGGEKLDFYTEIIDRGCFLYRVDDKGIVFRKTEQEIKADPNYIIYQKEKRAEAYVNESDVLFFKYQRGEIDKQAWLDKVAEIKARYPKE